MTRTNYVTATNEPVHTGIRIVDCSLPTVTISITPQLEKALFILNAQAVEEDKPAWLVQAIEDLRADVARARMRQDVELAMMELHHA